VVNGEWWVVGGGWWTLLYSRGSDQNHRSLAVAARIRTNKNKPTASRGAGPWLPGTNTRNEGREKRAVATPLGIPDSGFRIFRIPKSRSFVAKLLPSSNLGTGRMII